MNKVVGPLVLALSSVFLVLGCAEVPSLDQVEVIKTCANACGVGRMQKWNPKDGCVCDTAVHPKP